MDVTSADLHILHDDYDDHMLFSTEDLEGDLSAAVADYAQGDFFVDSEQFYGFKNDDLDNETATADSIPSLHTAHKGASETINSRGIGSADQPKKNAAKRKSQTLHSPLMPKRAVRATASFPEQEHDPTHLSVEGLIPEEELPPKVTTASKKGAKKRKASVKRKIEPLAKQVFSGSGRGSRQKMFSWADRMVQLAEYKEKNGHIAIPTVRRDPYFNLGLWLAAQRSLYRKQALRKDRLADLRKLGCLGFEGEGG